MRSLRIFFGLWLLAPLPMVEGRPWTVAFGLYKPPYVNFHNQSGYSVDLVRLIFDDMREQFNPLFVSNKRMESLLTKGQVNAVVGVTPIPGPYFFSDTFMVFRNFIVVRKGILTSVKSYADLRDKSVCTWQGAQRDLGQELVAQIGNFKSYGEFPDQSKQVQSWLLGQCQAIIIDDRILKYFWAEALERGRSQLRLQDVDWFETPTGHESETYVGFGDKDLRNRFNASLLKIKKMSRWKDILNQLDGRLAARPPNEMAP